MYNFSIKNDTIFGKNHKTIIRFLNYTLLKHKNISMPKNLKITLYDCEGFFKQTRIFEIGKEYGYAIDLNLAEILRLYKGKNKDLHRIRKTHLPKFKSFKNYLLFVLYHELGHYNLKHLFNEVYYDEHTDICEVKADKFSLKILKQKGGI